LLTDNIDEHSRTKHFELGSSIRKQVALILENILHSLATNLTILLYSNYNVVVLSDVLQLYNIIRI